MCCVTEPRGVRVHVFGCAALTERSQQRPGGPRAKQPRSWSSRSVRMETGQDAEILHAHAPPGMLKKVRVGQMQALRQCWRSERTAGRRGHGPGVSLASSELQLACSCRAAATPRRVHRPNDVLDQDELLIFEACPSPNFFFSVLLLPQPAPYRVELWRRRGPGVDSAQLARPVQAGGKFSWRAAGLVSPQNRARGPWKSRKEKHIVVATGPENQILRVSGTTPRAPGIRTEGVGWWVGATFQRAARPRSGVGQGLGAGPRHLGSCVFACHGVSHSLSFQRRCPGGQSPVAVALGWGVAIAIPAATRFQDAKGPFGSASRWGPRSEGQTSSPRRCAGKSVSKKTTK